MVFCLYQNKEKSVDRQYGLINLTIIKMSNNSNTKTLNIILLRICQLKSLHINHSDSLPSIFTLQKLPACTKLKVFSAGIFYLQ